MRKHPPKSPLKGGLFTAPFSGWRSAVRCYHLEMEVLT